MTSSDILRIAFIGAGTVNFGREDVPWDHASRLEKIGGIEVIGIADPDIKKATDVLEKRIRSTEYGHLYTNCKILEDSLELIPLKPDAVFIGIPPLYRGCMKKGHDLELRFVKAGIHVFVEKPLSAAPPEDVLFYADAVDAASKKNNVVVSVGYMFRYHAAVLKMKELVKEHGGKVMMFNARYYYAYIDGSAGRFTYYYNSNFNGGPIVEQATHFCDLARFIVSDIDNETVNTIMLKESDAGGAGHLAHVPGGSEDNITLGERIPRVTLSHWRFIDGGVGSLTHSLPLPGRRYEANIDVQLDGLKLSLIEPYEDDCILRVRSHKMKSPNEDCDFTFKNNDSYHEELAAFISAVRSRDQTKTKSSYRDAAKTYAMTWAIRRAGEKN